jgi:hypothetical protein
MMWDDPIVAETRRIRDEIAARHQYNIQAMGAYYQAKRATTALQQIAAAVQALQEQAVREQKASTLVLVTPRETTNTGA